jgi:Holliday junction DNA helicase RuvA
MIAHLSGKLLFSSDRFVVIETGGVGYKVRVPIDTLRALKTKMEADVSLWIHTSVREDTLDLYGFEKQDDMEFFEMLISVSGIGPKSALGILNIAPVNHLREAIAAGDTGALTKVSGIGSKGAQKIILELREKMGGRGTDLGGSMLREERDAIEGLVALGYPERDAREALKNVSADIKGTGARIKDALKHIGK